MLETRTTSRAEIGSGNRGVTGRPFRVTGPHPSAKDHNKPLSKVMRENLREYEERRKVRLPLEEESRVTCVTCHNPHERGLLKGAAGIGADEDKRLRLTTYNEQCTPCHEKK